MARRAADAAPPGEASTNGVVFWPVAVLALLVDQATKGMAAYALAPEGFPHPVVGDWVRLTLVHNPGAAFGWHLGPWSRWIFLALTVVVLRVLWRMYRETRDRDNLRTLALALVCSGAVGNGIDRLRSSRGVVDFLDVGAGAFRWPTFNVADIAVTGGALLLALVLWREDGAAATDDAPPAARPTAAPAASGARGAELA